MTKQEKKELKIKVIGEIKLLLLQLKYCEKHFDVWFPIAVKIKQKIFRLEIIQKTPTTPTFPSGGLTIIGDTKRPEIIV